jgi:hypothetical protein
VILFGDVVALLLQSAAPTHVAAGMVHAPRTCVSACCSQKPSALYSRIKVASELENASGGLGLVTQVVVAGKTGEPHRQWRS